MLLFQYYGISVDAAAQRAAHLEGAVVGAVTGGNVEDYREMILGAMLGHDFFGVFPEGNRVVVHVGEMTYQQGGQIA